MNSKNFGRMLVELARLLFADKKSMSDEKGMYRVEFFLHNDKDDKGWRKERLFKCGVGKIKITNNVTYPGIFSSGLKPWVSKDYFTAASDLPFVLLIKSRAGGCFANMDGQTTVMVAGPAITKVPVGSSKVYSYYTKLAPGARSCHSDIEWTRPEMVADGQPYPEQR